MEDRGLAVISRKRRAFALIILVFLLAGCILEGESPVEETPSEETPKKDPAGEEPEEEAPAAPDRGSLDPRLYGLWRFAYNGKVMEEIEISAEVQGEGNLGSLTYRGIYQSADLQEVFAGDIVYGANFSEKAGVLIIEYWPGHKQVWIDWGASFYPYDMVPLSPQPRGNFYGIYFLRLNEEGTEVLLACTSDQNDNYGPTEALTLEEAAARFTEENRPLWMHLSVGDPQQKVEERENEEGTTQ
jgi:hypothetical protein